MKFKEYVQYDALGLADLVKKGEVSAKELLTLAITQANKVNPKLNAIIHRFDERAYTNASKGLPKGVFEGVPFLLKDLSFDFKGEPITMGCASVNITSNIDCEIVKRMKATGVNSFGKTNTPEFGLIITTEPKAHGATHNPFKKGYSCGGSSGGSAVSVASGIVPMASAGDGGGSIRFPAAWCGVFGLKPSRGRNPLGPLHGEGWDGAIADHVITKTVRDSAAMLDALHGKEIGAPYDIAPPTGTFLEAVNTRANSAKPLKIAVLADPLIANTQVDQDVLAQLQKTAKQLEAMGHVVEDATLNIDKARFLRDFTTVVCAHTAFLCQDLANRYGKQTISKIETRTKNLAMLGRSLGAVDLINAKAGWHDVQYKTGLLLATYDVILCPTVPSAAVKLGVLPPSKLDEMLMSATSHINIGKQIINSPLLEKFSSPVMNKMAFTILGNMTGLPAASLPLGMSKKGLPIGMQIIGRMGAEATLLSLAADFESAGLFTPLA